MSETKLLRPQFNKPIHQATVKNDTSNCDVVINEEREGFLMITVTPKAPIYAALPAWQPIETAPSNESVLVFVPDREHYGPGIYRAIYVNHPERCAPYWSTFGMACGRDIPSDSLPTHWMPLPDPPAARPPLESGAR